VATTSSGRGKGLCPKCNTSYANRHKPQNCPKCNFQIGGSYVPKKRTAKATVPPSTVVFSKDRTNIYSVTTTTRNDRCFVVVDDGLTMCHYSECKDSRSSFVYSNRTEDFTCAHREKALSSLDPEWTSRCTPDMIENYSADANVKSAMINVINENADIPHTVQVSENVFAVYSQPCASNPIGYTHIKKEKQFYSCTSKDCRATKVKTKQLGAKNICMHIHMLLCCMKTRETVSTDIPDDVDDSDAVAKKKKVEKHQEDSVSRQATKKLYADFKLPYKIDVATLTMNEELECKTVLGQDGWPDVFEPNEECCSLCKSDLGTSRPHPGSGGEGILITSLNPFKNIHIKVKMCSNASCKAMHRVFPTNYGMYTLKCSYHII
jgi:hypothetical protein